MISRGFRLAEHKLSGRCPNHPYFCNGYPDVVFFGSSASTSAVARSGLDARCLAKDAGAGV